MALNRMITGAVAALLAGTFAVSASAQEKMSSGSEDQLAMQQRVQMWDANEYMRLQGAVEAQSLCRGELSEPAMRAAVNVIEHKTGEPLSPGQKLAVMDDAKWSIKQHILEEGCATPRAKQALSTFDTEIAPGIHGVTMD